MITVAIVEDSAGVRENWARLINAASGFKCVGTFASGEAALKALPSLRPDVVLMDINLPGLSGIECTARLKELLPETQILMVTVHGDNERVFAALQAGASGYLLKRTRADELLEAISEVMRGGAPMTGEIARMVIASFRRPASTPGLEAARLTPREEEILALLTQGYSNKEIADRLSVSFDTVRTHLRHVYEKLHVRSRTEAATKYLRATERLGGPAEKPEARRR
ncbi:MAG: response regulator transcription factor [Verrucomicrobiae bacterium]|nr:response regulator transcription factor [Verrucomicrobiae bacterium]MDW8310083.1 response regulator transcription factor [Verrucomicrobiales bacterium]